MCLKNVGKRKIAQEDIVVYKRLVKEYIPQNMEQYNGKPFTGIIFNRMVDGIISIEDEDMFFCTDNYYLNGDRCFNKYGKRYSWILDGKVNVESIMVDDIPLDVITVFKTPYQRVVIELGKTYTSKLVEKYDEYNEYNTTVEVGLHSFASKTNARNDGSGIIVKCIIPKGSEYYEGSFDRHCSFASNVLHYTTDIVSGNP